MFFFASPKKNQKKSPTNDIQPVCRYSNIELLHKVVPSIFTLFNNAIELNCKSNWYKILYRNQESANKSG